LSSAFERITPAILVEEERMRKLSAAAVAMILAIALYFMLAWGYDGLALLTSSSYGLDDVWHSQFLFSLGRMFALTPTGIIKLAAFFATLKLAVGVICAIHIVDRLRHVMRGQADTGIFEAGLILVIAISIVSAGPAVWSQDGTLLRETMLQLSLAGLAAALCVIERRYKEANAIDVTAATATVAPSAPGTWYSMWQ
jgi:hypothetical protein